MVAFQYWLMSMLPLVYSTFSLLILASSLLHFLLLTNWSSPFLAWRIRILSLRSWSFSSLITFQSDGWGVLADLFHWLWNPIKKHTIMKQFIEYQYDDLRKYRILPCNQIFLSETVLHTLQSNCMLEVLKERLVFAPSSLPFNTLQHSKISCKVPC